MSEKRFSVRLRSECDGVVYSFFDGDKPLDVEMIVDVLNEQQATIQSLQTELELVSGAKLFSRRELERKVKEQQDTIRKLQDLCGQSDYENAKLRIENKMLEKEVNLLRPTNLEQYEQIQKLQEENEQLQAQLREKEQDERLYANEIVKLNKEAKEVLDFKSLGGDY